MFSFALLWLLLVWWRPVFTSGLDIDIFDDNADMMVGSHNSNVNANANDANDNLNNDDNPSDDIIRIAGMFDTTGYDWSPDVFNFTFQLINEGWWDIIDPKISPTKVTYELKDSQCNEMQAVQAYYDMFHDNNAGSAFQGIVGPRCSGAALAMARFASLEGIPQISPTTESAILSNKKQFPLFNRLVPPSDERGHAGATIALLRELGWNRIGILSTDTAHSKHYVSHLRRTFLGYHHHHSNNNSSDADADDDWTGEIAFDVSIHVDADTNELDTVHAQQMIASVASDSEDPSDAKVVLLVGYPEHKLQILRQVYQNQYFSPAVTYVGVPSSLLQECHKDLGVHLPPGFVPGWLEVEPHNNYRDPHYQDFLGAFNHYRRQQGKDAFTFLPSHADNLVDSIRCMVSALVETHPSLRSNGTVVVEKLRNLTFDGVGGRVEFIQETGDPKAPIYTVKNARSVGETNGIQWKDLGTTSTSIGSVQFYWGIEAACFAEVGCGLQEAPSDRFPEKDDETPLWGVWVSAIFALTLLALVALLCKTHRMKQEQANMEARLEKFQESLVGMRTARCNYVPKIVPPGAEEDKRFAMRRQSSQFSMGSLINFARSPSRGKANPMMRSLRMSVSKVLPSHNLPNNTRINLQREDSVVEFGKNVPNELANEPQLVLVEDDVVQISSQRLDGWAFGTKLHHSHPEAEEQMASLALLGISAQDGEGRVSTDTGWLRLDKTRDPTKKDLGSLQSSLGDTNEMHSPSHWTPTDDAAQVQRVPLHDPDHDERKEVEDSFVSTLPNDVVVLKVERIQNLALWQSYVVKRRVVYNQEVGHFPAKDDPETQKRNLDRLEKRAFHGCDASVVEKIIQQGFNRSFCGKNATLYGKGVYFARDSSYSSSTIYAKPDDQGRQYILASRVIVGSFCKGKEDALTPDLKDEGSHALYDTTVDNVEDPSIFVTYHDAQAYPEYLITFSIPKDDYYENLELSRNWSFRNLEGMEGVGNEHAEAGGPREIPPTIAREIPPRRPSYREIRPMVQKPTLIGEAPKPRRRSLLDSTGREQGAQSTKPRRKSLLDTGRELSLTLEMVMEGHESAELNCDHADGDVETGPDPREIPTEERAPESSLLEIRPMTQEPTPFGVHEEAPSSKHRRPSLLDNGRELSLTLEMLMEGHESGELKCDGE